MSAWDKHKQAMKELQDAKKGNNNTGHVHKMIEILAIIPHFTTRK